MVAAPIWKTAYRLVLPNGGGNARLQGWAVVENLTGGDWSDIELVLVSGNPVALRQPLYTAVFADRLEVPVTTAARSCPAPTTGGSAEWTQAEPRQKPRTWRGSCPGAVQQAQIAAAASSRTRGGTTTGELWLRGEAAEAEEASTQLLYRFPAKISLATGHTMMVPFVDREIVAARTWLYQPENGRAPSARRRARAQ